MKKLSARNAIIEISARVHKNGFAAAYDGNVSARTEDGVLITARGTCKGALCEKDIIACPYPMNAPLPKEASTETPMHIKIYDRFPDCRAIIHAHPPFTCVLGLSRQGFPNDVIPELLITAGKVHTLPYATPGSGEAAALFENLDSSCRAALLRQHGAVTFGKDLEQAYMLLEKLEHASKTIVLARLYDTEHAKLDKTEQERLFKVFSNSRH